MAGNVFRHQHRVGYAECTVGNHVYYARYLDILEVARGEFFRQLGTTSLQWQERDVIFPVVESRLRYKAPARYDDMLTVEVRVTTAMRARLNFACRVINQAGTLIVEAETHHVCTGQDERPKRLPVELCEQLRPFLHAAEAAG